MNLAALEDQLASRESRFIRTIPDFPDSPTSFETAEQLKHDFGLPGLAPGVNVPEHIAGDLVARVVPSEETILWLATNLFNDATAIALILDTLVVCLPETTEAEFTLRLRNLPERLYCSFLSLRFHNGPLEGPELRRERVVQPEPRFLPIVADETDYVTLDGCFYPGTMVCSRLSSSSAGILVSRGREIRLTLAYHSWEEDFERQRLIHLFTDRKTDVQVLQGGNDTLAGIALDRVGSTDFLLGKLRVPFKNSFMDMDCTPKRLLPIREVRVGDSFLISSYVTGKTRLESVGASFGLARSRRGHPALVDGPNPEEHYIRTRQGVFSANAPDLRHGPQLRRGACGAVLVRCRYSRSHGAAKRAMPEDQVLALGEVAAMIHFSDLQSRHAQDSQLLCYSDSFEELIRQGWEMGPESNRRGM